MSVVVPALPIAVDPLIAEAKQRARRRRLLIVTAVLLAAGAITGGVLAFGGGGSSGEIPWSATRPQLGPANPPLALPCTASQLRATLQLQGATQQLIGPISIVNRSSQRCSLLGRPKLSFVNATSRWQETRLQASTFALPLDPLAPPRGSLRALAPGEHVSAMLWWSNWCGRGARPGGSLSLAPSGILLTLPSGGRLRVGHWHGRGGPVCNGGPGSSSTLQAGSFTPYVPTGPPSSALPLQARIVSAGVLTIKGKTLSEPTLVGRLGSWLSYTVVLTNRSDRPFSFGRTCPAYVEDWGGIAPAQGYVLNCRSVGSIGPGQSVRFAMRQWVPRHLSLPVPALGWTLAPHTYDAPQTLAVLKIRS